jgi:putative ABC transport system permease protein
MFFVTYLRRELRRRLRQAIFVALGLAVGIGLVVTVSAASTGVKKAEAGVLSSLYGVGTDVTVTGPAPTAKPNSGNAKPSPGQSKSTLHIGPNGAQICTNGKCVSAAGQSFDQMNPAYTPFKSSKVPAVARLQHVLAAAGGLVLTDNRVTIPKNFGTASGSAVPTPTSLSVDGVDIGRLALGPLSSGTITSGHSFTAADADSDVAVVDSGYATSNSLKVGSALTIDKVKFTVIGIVRQGQTTSPNDVYIPLGSAQALQIPGSSFAGDVNAIYVTAASAASIPAVQHEIAKLLPHDTVTTAASLAGEVTGSVSSAAKLANDLGKWLAVLVLIAAFAVACLLTMSAVSRRVAEFGTLKAIGWKTRRIIAQVLGESVVMGIIGAAVGVGLGFAGAAVITAVEPKLSATIGGNTEPQASAAGGFHSGPIGGPGSQSHTVSVPLHPSVTIGVITLAAVLALAGALLAGSVGSWRIAKLRPADALSRVA